MFSFFESRTIIATAERRIRKTRLTFISSAPSHYYLSLFLALLVLLNNFGRIENARDWQQHDSSESPSEFRSHVMSKRSGVNFSSSSYSKKESILNSIKQNNHKIIALADKSVTLTCSIDLDDKNFSKSEDYKIIWSREIENGKDYEPLALDEIRLVSNARISSTRALITRQSHDRIEWTLVINGLKSSDTSNYICQLNRKPYDIYWLRRFMLSVYEPAYFVDSSSENSEPTSAMQTYENSVFVKSINEYQDFKLKCLAKGKPKPTVSWYLRYINNTLIQLNIEDNEIIIKNIKRNSKIDKVECQATNGYGATAIRSFKINIKHSPHIISKSKFYRVPTRTSEIKLNCTLASNPLATVNWLFLPKTALPDSMFEHAHGNQTKENEQFIEASLKYEWISINHHASYSLKYTNSNNNNQDLNNAGEKALSNEGRSNVSIIKMPLSKYQIYEKHLAQNSLTSILIIKQITEKDSGIYKCFSANEVGNKSVEFKIQALEHETESSERQRDLLKSKKNPYSFENSRNYKYNNVKGEPAGENDNDKSDEYMLNEKSLNRATCFHYRGFNEFKFLVVVNFVVAVLMNVYRN